MRARNHAGVPVVVQARRGRGGAARALWGCAEALVTCGVLVLLLVAHQLWWTNEQARAEAGRAVHALEREWADPSKDLGGGPAAGPGDDPATDPGGGPGGGDAVTVPTDSGPDTSPPGTRTTAPYAVLRIPRLGIEVPVAPGVGKRSVLDKGFAGHYPGTAQPGRTGNFALAGHRNTHGEPFRHINRLRPGDTLTVRTRDGTYTYRVDQVLPATSARDTGVVAPVPRSRYHPSYGYDTPGAYLTLTTCTPEFTSRYRLIVWAKLMTS
ncbi:class E sortase [Streptomyces sp. NPDC090025]|uniref:class E sortase n=1 Tax=Streptomyces sp. NPDC090025 TaxID=3365922 RepID=UPI0038326827